MSVGGLGNFSAVDLEKVLAGKKASVSYGIGDKTETVNGSCSPKDFENNDAAHLLDVHRSTP